MDLLGLYHLIVLKFWKRMIKEMINKEISFKIPEFIFWLMSLFACLFVIIMACSIDFFWFLVFLSCIV
jgi:hypothetical protein